MIDSQITDTYTTLENLDLFMNAVTANFDKTKNVAIKAKSLEVSNNTMQHAGIIIIQAAVTALKSCWIAALCKTGKGRLFTAVK